VCEAAFLNCPLGSDCPFSSPFGYRYDHPVDGPGVNKKHNGVDYAAPSGAPVYPAKSGTVLRVTTQYCKTDPTKMCGYGHYIILKHFDGSETLYAHLSKMHAEVGQDVGLNTKIGDVGNTGTSSGPHLHLEYATSGPILSDAPNYRIDPHPCISKS